MVSDGSISGESEVNGNECLMETKYNGEVVTGQIDDDGGNDDQKDNSKNGTDRELYLEDKYFHVQRRKRENGYEFIIVLADIKSHTQNKNKGKIVEKRRNLSGGDDDDDYDTDCDENDGNKNTHKRKPHGVDNEDEEGDKEELKDNNNRDNNHDEDNDGDENNNEDDNNNDNDENDNNGDDNDDDYDDGYHSRNGLSYELGYASISCYYV